MQNLHPGELCCKSPQCCGACASVCVWSYGSTPLRDFCVLFPFSLFFPPSFMFISSRFLWDFFPFFFLFSLFHLSCVVFISSRWPTKARRCIDKRTHNPHTTIHPSNHHKTLLSAGMASHLQGSKAITVSLSSKALGPKEQSRSRSFSTLSASRHVQREIRRVMCRGVPVSVPKTSPGLAFVPP